MKKLFAIFMSLTFLGWTATAQNNTTTRTATLNEYQRYIDARLDMDFRNMALETLNFSSEEIKEFDPLFIKYTQRKDDLAKKRMDLLEDFREELAEDDSVENENEDRADFIEDYWEIDIAEQELKKEFFDDLEDEIPVNKAIEFTLLDEAIERRITNNTLGEMIPFISDFDRDVKANLAINKAVKNMVKTRNMMPSADVSREDYRRYVDSKLEMDLRNAALKSLDFTTEEIIAFDPVYFAYMTKKEDLLEEKVSLLEDFRAEMKEDDGPENQAEDRADFIEDYREVEIAISELKKDNFDILEDKVGVRKALEFFLWEDAVQNRVVLNTFAFMFPVTEKVTIKSASRATDREMAEDMERKSSMKTATKTKSTVASLSTDTKKMIKTFDAWVRTNRGQVDLSHEYTSDGLITMVNTLEAMKNDLAVDVPNFTMKKQMIVRKAKDITENWKATNHADHTKDAFIAVAEIMNSMGADYDLKNIAMRMSDKVLMTEQAETIYSFFDAANEQLMQLASDAGYTSNKIINDSNTGRK
ncbi:MAG: hypothetical protein AB8G22_06920 [Saprospiraceae bacterium]